ncbi:hypothetical protein JW865_03015 [Candidatus Bathyarchaeota archaeon]|nr:hypothetical protein [Candidatus Bathyarchaeota archaeon]MBN2617130.1 hypothetical protein [Spirochaetales bacterium]
MGLLKMNVARSVVLLLIVISSTYLYSETNRTESSFSVASAYYFPDHGGYNLESSFAPITYTPIEAVDDTERNIGSTWGALELQGNYNYTLIRPFLTGSGVLTQNNYLKNSLKFGLTPVDINFSINNIFSPIAFLEFSLGSSIATGWKAIGVNGLALYSDPINGPEPDPFQGVLSKTWLAGTFQFDFAAILKGDITWKHIVVLSNHTLNFSYFTAADNDTPWIYQGADPQLNGFRYNHSSFIGYKMPTLLNTTGLLIETEQYLFDNADRSLIEDGGWGSDYIQLTLGWLFNFSITENQSIVILPQIRNKLHYTDDTAKNIYFFNRLVDTDSSTYWDFHRVAFSYSYKF